MEKDYICKCNKCGNLLIDENPLHSGEKKELNGSELEMVLLHEKYYLDGRIVGGDTETHYFWACPICLTDDYLMDI